MARCPGCGKMASYDDSVEPEILDESLEVVYTEGGFAQGSVSGTVRVVLTSACCSEELKDAELEYNIEWEHTCPDNCIPDEGNRKEALPDERFEIKGVTANFNSRQQTEAVNRKTGKVTKIKNSRYAKMYYGAVIEAEITCAWCLERYLLEPVDVEEQASAFNELV